MPPDKNNKEDKPQMFPRITESEICLDRNGVVANICLSKRRTDTDGIFVDGQLYAERFSVERTNAWMDSYRTLLNRFDTMVSNWESWNYLAFTVLLFLRKFYENEKFKSLQKIQLHLCR